MSVQIVSSAGLLIERLVEGFVKLLERDIQSKHEIIAHFSAYRWCDSTERALNRELMGRGGWFAARSESRD